ncbi:tetratricopeptide repeat protein [bacterium]|nr:tetratricopeptide repeat protein [bacterium]
MSINLYQDAYNLHTQGKLEEAKAKYLEFVSINPSHSDALNMLGLAYYQTKMFNEAIDAIIKALKIKEDAYYYECLGMVYLDIREYQAAQKTFERATELNPNNAENWFNLANVHKALNNLEVSETLYKKALEINPELTISAFNLATLYANNLDRPKDAIEMFQRVLKKTPDDLETKYFISLNYFKDKDYKTGMKYFENRLCRKSAIISQEKSFPNIMKTAKVWEGQTDKTATIYTYYEAGFGDIIMYARYLPLVKERCKKLIFRPRSELTPLFEDNPQLGVDYLEYLTPEEEIHFDYHIPLLSMPYALGLDNDSIFVTPDRYMVANPVKSALFKEKYCKEDGKLKIGIKWQGNTYYDVDRVITIESFFKIFELANTQFYSMQTAEGSEELEKCEKYGVVDVATGFENFSDTAAAIDNMDLIISNDSSLAHLAGAMGKPCFILLPYIYNWRWHLDLSKCDWYDSVKLFSQKSPSDWDEVMERVRLEIEKHL